MKIKNPKFLAAMICCFFLLCGCATVEIYTDKHLKKNSKSGIPFFSPKPYLLVETNPAKDVAIKTTLIYLPDFENPKYAKITPGFGSADLKIALENGILTSYGITSDSKVPETITAMGGVIENITGILPLINELSSENKILADEKINGDDLKNIKERMKIIYESLIKDLSKNESWLPTLKQNKIKDILKILKSTLDELDEEDKIEISGIVKKIELSIKQFEEVEIGADSPNSKEWNAIVADYKKELLGLKNLIVPPIKVESKFALYEIKQVFGSTKLIKVELKIDEL